MYSKKIKYICKYQTTHMIHKIANNIFIIFEYNENNTPLNISNINN